VHGAPAQIPRHLTVRAYLAIWFALISRVHPWGVIFTSASSELYVRLGEDTEFVLFSGIEKFWGLVREFRESSAKVEALYCTCELLSGSCSVFYKLVGGLALHSYFGHFGGCGYPRCSF
jgi:hypothetical protein